MTIKQQGGIFGRNPTFNDVTVDNDLTVNKELTVLETASIARKSTDGDILTLKKDSTAVTKFGSVSGVVSYIVLDPRTSSAKGSGFLGSSADASEGIIQGVDGSGALAGGTITLGTLANPFKELYLGGDVHVASGQGIDFSATSGTGTSELFSDYEEGSFTPSLSFVGGSTGITHTLQYGSYRKIGDMVFVMGRIALSNKGSDTGQVRINLPYGVSATSGENGGAALVYGNNFTSVTSDNLVINGIGNTATASMFPATTGSSLTDANILNNTDFIFNFSYIAS